MARLTLLMLMLILAVAAAEKEEVCAEDASCVKGNAMVVKRTVTSRGEQQAKNMKSSEGVTTPVLRIKPGSEVQGRRCSNRFDTGSSTWGNTGYEKAANCISKMISGLCDHNPGSYIGWQDGKCNCVWEKSRWHPQGCGHWESCSDCALYELEAEPTTTLTTTTITITTTTTPLPCHPNCPQWWFLARYSCVPAASTPFDCANIRMCKLKCLHNGNCENGFMVSTVDDRTTAVECSSTCAVSTNTTHDTYKKVDTTDPDGQCGYESMGVQVLRSQQATLLQMGGERQFT